MNILYVHGFGSRFDRANPKVPMLEKFGTVFGVDIDWCQPAEDVLADIAGATFYMNIDLIAGTSMGGWASMQLGAELNIPFIAINPSIFPDVSLAKHIGSGVDYTGREYTLTKEVTDSYFTPMVPRPISVESMNGLILLDMGDELLDSAKTRDMFSTKYTVKTYAGGSHRFDNIDAALPDIKEYVDWVKSKHDKVGKI